MEFNLNLTIEKTVFFLEHGKTDWAISEFEATPFRLKSELAQASLRPAIEALFSRERELDDWLDLALAAPSSAKSKHAGSWVEALIWLSDNEDELALAIMEDMISTMPFDIYDKKTPKGDTWLEQLQSRTSARHRDWATFIRQIMDAGYEPAPFENESPLLIPEITREQERAIESILDEFNAKRNDYDDDMDCDLFYSAVYSLSRLPDSDLPTVASATLGSALDAFKKMAEADEADEDMNDKMAYWIESACSDIPGNIYANPEWIENIATLSNIEHPMVPSWLHTLADATPMARLMQATGNGKHNKTVLQHFGLGNGLLRDFASRVESKAEAKEIKKSLNASKFAVDPKPARKRSL